MISSRKPYPFPTYENDEKFTGTTNAKLATTLVGTLSGNAWSDLYSHATLSSARREVSHFDPSAPRDSLDFVLKAEYNNHQEFLKGKNETLVQRETLDMPHGRILKNRTFNVPPEAKPLNHSLRVAEGLQKKLIYSIKNAIEGHHTQTTNRGYARKPDGGFFMS